MGRSKVGTIKKRSPDGLIYPNQTTIIINIICWYIIRDGKSTLKFNEQRKMDLNNRKMKKNHPPSPVIFEICPNNKYFQRFMHRKVLSKVFELLVSVRLG